MKQLLSSTSGIINISAEAQEWYNWDWDKAHVIELAFKTANEVDLMNRVDKTVHTVNKKFSLGKAFGDLRYHTPEDQKLQTPIQSSSTRFAYHQHTVLTNFMNNYNIFYDSLNASRDNDLNRMENLNFVLALSAKADLLASIQKMSKSCQEVGVNSWRLYDGINAQFTEIKAMVNSIGSDDIHEHFNNLKTTITELKDTKTFKGKPVVF